MGVFRVVARGVKHNLIDQLHSAGLGVDHAHQWRKRVLNAGKANDGQPRALWFGNNLKRGFHHHRQGAF